jgi:YVTN family beta-propeller protein
MNAGYKKLWSIVLLLTTFFFIQGCSDDDPEPVDPGTHGFFIVNEGGYPNDNSSISFYNSETDKITEDVFFSINGRKLGVQAQSMTVFEDKGYIMVQGSAKIEVIDANTYKSIATITEEIESPRYFLGVSATKGYVSDWGANGVTGTVKVIDLSTNTVTKTIATGKGANRMLKVGNAVYVTNAGGWGNDNTVKIIDTNTDAVTATITVGDNPNSIQLDAAGNIWVASSGAIAYDENWNIDEENSTKGSLSKITPDNTESLRLEVASVTSGGAGNLSVSPDGKTLYYTFNGGVYSLSNTATALPTTALVTKSYYGLVVDPASGNLIGTLAPNFSSAGTIEVLTPSGSVVDTHTAGIGPNGVAFK